MHISSGAYLANVEELSLKLRHDEGENVYFLTLSNTGYSSTLIFNYEQLEELHNVLTIAVNEGGR